MTKEKIFFEKSLTDDLNTFFKENRAYLKGVIEDTIKKNTEFGMSICKYPPKDFKLSFSEMCQGESCNVFPTQCDKESGEETIAKFHTHILTKKLSNQDKAVGIIHNERMNCLGYKTEEDNKADHHIDCYEHPYGISKKRQEDIIDINNELSSINYKMVRADQSSDIYNKLSDLRSKLFKERLNLAESDIEPLLRITL